MSAAKNAKNMRKTYSFLHAYLNKLVAFLHFIFVENIVNGFNSLCKNNDISQRSGWIALILHVIIIVLIIVDFAFLFPSQKPKKQMAIPIEMIQLKLPVKEKTNIKKKAATVKKNEKKTEKKEAKKVKYPDRPKPTPKRIVSKPKPRKIPNIKKRSLQKKPVKKKVVKKPEVKPELKKKKIKPATINKVGEKKVEKQDAVDYDPTAPMSISQKDAIRAQLVGCWNIIPGAQSSDAIVVKFHVNKNGAVDGKVKIVDNYRYKYDSVFRAAADRAVNAVIKCSPLKGLNKKQYDEWQDMEFTFDPRDVN